MGKKTKTQWALKSSSAEARVVVHACTSELFLQPRRKSSQQTRHKGQPKVAMHHSTTLCRSGGQTACERILRPLCKRCRLLYLEPTLDSPAFPSMECLRSGSETQDVPLVRAAVISSGLKRWQSLDNWNSDCQENLPPAPKINVEPGSSLLADVQITL